MNDESILHLRAMFCHDFPSISSKFRIFVCVFLIHFLVRWSFKPNLPSNDKWGLSFTVKLIVWFFGRIIIMLYSHCCMCIIYLFVFDSKWWLSTFWMRCDHSTRLHSKYLHFVAIFLYELTRFPPKKNKTHEHRLQNWRRRYK